MSITKRISKFLLIAALAFPAWNAASAQKPTAPPENMSKAEVDAGKAMIAPVQIVSNVSADERSAMSVEQSRDAAKPFKTLKLRNVATSTKTLKVTKVTKTRADVPAGYSLITLNVTDTGDPGTGVWGDGTGYQMLLDADHSTYGSTIPTSGGLTSSGNASNSTYALFEYKIPENADGSLTTTNMILSGSQSITIPAGTYDWCITNPTPNDRMWIASLNGDIQGRYDDYVFESGFAYTFTISYVGQNDNVGIEITSNFENPVNLAVNNVTNHQATATWAPGGNEASWNVEYKAKTAFVWTSGGTVSSTNYLLENLDALTSYQVRVQGIYDGGKSGWEMLTFKTLNSSADFCDPEEMGEISYTLNDSYGDGWNSAAINIVDSQSGTIIESITLESGSSASGTVSMCYGREVNFVWIKGDYNSECSFTITGPDGEVIYQASTSNCSSFNDGYVFKTYTMYMPVKPTDLAVSGVSYNRATATWNGVTETYNLRYRPNGETNWVVVENVTSPYTMTDLAPLTQYEVQVQGILDGGVSDWTNSVSFTTLEGPTQSLDFGTVNVNSNKTLNAKLMNESSSAVQATITVNPNPPFSVANTTVTLAANSLTSVPVTFAPTEARNFNGTLTVVAGGVTSIVTLTGVGDITGSPAAVRDSAFYAGITYNWTDSLGTTHTSNLTEIATDPDQMIAMIREVYTNKNIPGNYRRGYPSYSTNIQNVTEGFDKVYYSGVGKVNSSGKYEDAYGWGITGTVNTKSTYYQYLDTIQYRPYNEGTTLLLVEVRDDFEKTGSTTYVYDSSTNTTTYTTFYNDPYKNLRQILIRSIKSIRVITKAKRSGDGVEAGTLFKIDCNKMNKFYFMAKGQLNHTVNSLYGDNDWGCAPPSHDNYYTSSYKFYDYFSHPLFYHMFEQFSPVSISSEAPYADMYWDLVDMNSFNVEHDCMAVVPLMNHQFQMYGTNSGSDDCQDIRDLMFFVPDFRMLKWSGRETYTYRKFLNYNTAHAPKMGLFVIKQNTITGEQVSVEGAPTYKLHLTWASNLLDFMPDEDGMYTLYRVITDADGNKTYEVVCEFADPNTLDYYDYVPMQQNGQQVTYVVQGQDKGKFLDLQMSNEESYIIPGLDHAEQLRINLNSDYYFSRYDAAEQKNYYSNSLIANNTVGTNVKPNYIKNGSEFKFWRATLKTVDGQTVVDTENAVNFVTATVENYTEAGGGRLRYGNWSDDQVNFSSKPYGHGYHSTPETSNITISSGEVVFDGLKLYDNFCVSVEENTHPAQYVYYVTLETAVPFGLDQNLPSCAVWQEGTFAYFECNYGSTMRAWAWNDSGNLTGTQWPGTGTMTQVGTHNGNKVWLWTADSSVQPTGILFNWDNASSLEQTGNFTFTNGGYYRHGTDNVIAIVTEENTSNQARSNTVSVPVYKTAMTMVPITAADVEADMTHSKPAATQFTLNARYSSKDEILGYYIYRWADNDPEQPRTIYDEDGDDASPQGQAGNQADNYSVAMNTDYEAETEHFVMDANGRYPDVTATFVDNFMVNDAKDADTYTYAPVVELFAPHGAKVLNETTLNPTNEDRGDYNTYGGPQQMTAGGIVRVQVVKSAKSDYYWTANGKTYRYYNVYLYVDTLNLPTGYQVAKVRAWRKIAPQYLGEEEDKGYMSRLDLDANGEYVFVNKNACQKNDFLGDEVITNNVKKGTFGAVDVSTGETIPMKFVVRIYFTKNSSSKADGDQPYYIMETEIEDNLTDDIPVGINGVEVNRDVVSVKYYNVAGVESDQPFDGVNVVVTRYTDGSTSTSKVIK